jgi:hypothetical protein
MRKHLLCSPLPRRFAWLITTSWVLALIAAYVGAPAYGADSARLAVSFSPDRAGASTTIGFTVALSEEPGGESAPLTGMTLRLPVGMEFDESQLGIATCDATELGQFGLIACPLGSRMGYGHGTVRFAFAGEQHEAQANIAIVLGTAPGEGTPVLLYVETHTPVVAGLVFEGKLVEGVGHFGQQMDIQLPLIATLPGGPPVRIADMSLNFGPKELTYFRKIRGHRRAFKPRGLSVPPQCPRGGYPVAAIMDFADGSQTMTHSSVACPHANG